MTRRMIVPILLGIAGCCVLSFLGVWQMQRLVWKEAMLAEIDAKILGEPVSLPDQIDPVKDRYLPVRVTGTLLGEPLRILVSQKRVGAGYRLISAMDLGDRKIMVDRGVLPVDAAPAPLPTQPVEFVGNLHWPQEIDGFTPDPDTKKNIWFARDVPKMAQALGTEPVLLIARERSFEDADVQLLPVNSSFIPNDHLGYAVTWFSLAAIWFGMTAYLLWRIRQRTI